MPRKRARLSAAARRDLADIARHVAAESGEERSAGVIRAIARASDLYARRPAAGRPHPELGPEVRSFLVKRWRVYYVSDERGIGVLRILHTRRDLRAAWAEGSGKDERDPGYDP